MSAAPVSTIDPVIIEGDAGTQALLRRSDADRCWSERGDRQLSCAIVGWAAIDTAVAAPTGVGLLVGAVITAAATMNCVRLIVAHDECVDDTRAKREAAADCEAKGGVPLLTVRANELVCLVQR